MAAERFVYCFGRGGLMEFPEGKYAWMVKIGEKGQFVIPKEETRDRHFSGLFKELE